MSPIIDIILDGKLFATRNWAIIPRVGELIILGDGKVWTKVIQVIWSNDSSVPPSIIGERQWVQLVCEQIECPITRQT